MNFSLVHNVHNVTMPGETNPPEITGRDNEIASAQEFLSGSNIEGGARELSIIGEAGIGKTTFWRYLLHRAEGEGHLVLTARPSAAEARLSFAALADIFSTVPSEIANILPTPQRSAVDVALLRAPPGRRGANRRAVSTGLLTLFRQLAADRVVTIGVDDAQWLDRASRDAFTFVARRLSSERVHVICAYRTTDADSSDAPVSFGVGEQQQDPRRQRVLELGPLSLAALGRVLANATGAAPPRPILERIYRACRGNPFYALEISRMLDRDGTHPGARPRVGPSESRPWPVPGEPLPIPGDLRTLTAQRVGRLPTSTRNALLRASIRSTPQADTRSRTVLAPAEKAGLLHIDWLGRIEFSHPLVAAAVHSSAAPQRLRQLHREAAATIEDPEERARHLALGAGRADEAIAAELEAAAGLARARGASESAAELMELALNLTPTRDPGERAVARLVVAARYQLDAGDLSRAEELLEQALARCSKAPGTNSERAEALQLLALLKSRTESLMTAFHIACEGLEAAGNDNRLRTTIELDIAFYAVSIGDVAGGLPHAQAAVGHARATGDDELRAATLAVATMVQFLCGQGLDSAQLDEALALDDPSSTLPVLMRPRCVEGFLRLWTGDLARSYEVLATLRHELLEHGEESVAPLLAFFMVWCLLWQGRVAEAADLAAATKEAALLVGDSAVSAISLVASALVDAHCGVAARAVEAGNQALALFDKMEWRAAAAWALWAIGFASLTLDDPVAVDAKLGPLAWFVQEIKFGDPVGCIFLPDEIDALIALGELERASDLTELIERMGAEQDRPWALAAAARAQGSIAASRGDVAGAVAAFDEALKQHARVDMPLEVARTLLEAGRARRRFKSRREASAALRAALEIFETAGVVSWADKARTELARVSSTRSPPDKLTSTERTVATLAAADLSNREIAHRAFLTVKAVEANLTRVYRKLGVRSRAGLATALVDLEPSKIASP
jgi:DNA-binding CsgD family transcriptional regulator